MHTFRKLEKLNVGNDMNNDQKKLTEKLNAILEQLDGLSLHEIKVMLCNVEFEVNQTSAVNLNKQKQAVFNTELRPTK